MTIPAVRTTNDVLIKLVAPRELKQQLQELARSRNVTLSAIARIALTEYIKKHKW